MRLVMISACSETGYHTTVGHQWPENHTMVYYWRAFGGLIMYTIWDDQYTRVLMMSASRESGYHTAVGHQWPASNAPFQWRITSGPLVARLCMLSGKAHANWRICTDQAGPSLPA